MNLLGHLALSPPTNPQVMLGNLLGDCFKGRVENLPVAEGVRIGVRLHRGIDVYTDDHPAVLATIAKLRATHGRYASVVSDLLYDHLLASTWERWNAVPLREFLDQRYGQLAAERNLLDAESARWLDRIIEHDIMYSYRKVDGLVYALQRMQKRFRTPQNLDAIAHLSPNDFAEFAGFWPDARRAFGADG